jgi:glycosyltransferase involved in cell wall biosynthesis
MPMTYSNSLTDNTAASAMASVVIATHTLQRRKALSEAVFSVLNQQHQPREIVVAVDNNADLYGWVLRNLPRAVAVHNQGTRGASATRNAGARVAAGSVLVFLDDDAVARSDWLQNLTAPLAGPGVVGVAGLVEPIWLGRTPKWMPEEFLWVVGASYRGMPNKAAPVRNAWAENMAVARADFWAVNGFREGFGKTGQRSQPEDTDFCMRLTDAMPERTWWYEPSARVGHSVPPNRSTVRFFVQRCFNEGQGKAEIATLRGSRQALEEERRHATKILPQGIRRELRKAITSGEFAAALRASAIGLGLTSAGLGYLLRQLRPRAFAQSEVPR